MPFLCEKAGGINMCVCMCVYSTVHHLTINVKNLQKTREEALFAKNVTIRIEKNLKSIKDI